MTLFKVLTEEFLDKLYYEKIRSNATNAIERIREFTKSIEFDEADNITLDIKLGLLDMNFEKLMQANDVLLSINPEKDSIRYMEEVYTEIKTGLMSKKQCNLENVKDQSTITGMKFDGNKDNFKSFINVFNDKVAQNADLTTREKIGYLKSSLSGDALTLVNNVIPKADEVFDKMLKVLSETYKDGINYTTRPNNSEKDKFLITQSIALYENIVEGLYTDAVEVTKSVASADQGDFVTNVVKKLVKNGNRNLLSYVYQLWIGGAKNIVEQYMPGTFKMIFGGWVTPINKKYGLALKMDVNVDSDGDRIVWGDSNDKTSRRVSWKFSPFWDSNQVFFRIHNLEHYMYLKLEFRPDGIGDRGAFGSTYNESDRHAWILEPVVIDEDVCFYVINRQYNQGLKLQVSVDSFGDRKLWGDNGDVHRDPARFAWSMVLAQHNS